MKIETEIPDIKREEVIEAMARQLLGTWSEEYEHDTNAHYMQRTVTPLAKQMQAYLDDKIRDLADTLVREQFDATVNERIVAAVDATLAEGWQVTNSYGEARGPKVDLKGRITEILTTSTRDYSGPSMTPVERQVKAAIDGFMSNELGKEIEKARASLRGQLDAVIAGKFTETLKKGLGL